jgi:hypothetical protein
VNVHTAFGFSMISVHSSNIPIEQQLCPISHHSSYGPFFTGCFKAVGTACLARGLIFWRDGCRVEGINSFCHVLWDPAGVCGNAQVALCYLLL